jgi:hypothetical protein
LQNFGELLAVGGNFWELWGWGGFIFADCGWCWFGENTWAVLEWIGGIPGVL